ncbi:MAG TPA: IS1595 family transposase, partial [Xanthobacteraceae bacterium]|nr:IS1595 family transposase [Xanthobacteraceae bacterium]
MAKVKGPNIREFQKRFPTEDVCLEHLMRTRFGERLTCFKCQKQATYYRVKARRSFECEHCGYQVYPTAGTPFESTRTPLRDWFYVMFLFCASRNGVAAKEVQRQLGVTYKTAWRMCNLIRKYMGYVDGDFPLGGPGKTVEADETFIGGKEHHGKSGPGDKAIVFGIVERGGDVLTRHVLGRTQAEVIPHMQQYVKKGSKVYTDDWVGYLALTERAGFEHESVNHSAKEHVRDDVHTNTIEAFWANVKRGIKGTYVWVSRKHLQTYLREFEYRHNLRQTPYLMFD